MKQPLVSVVIPAYNEEENIGTCLASLAAQKTKYPLEVILSDNNSKDKTVEVAAKYKNDLNLRIVHAKKQGRGAARAKGFAEARGEFIFSSDADSKFPPNWIEEMMKGFADKNVVAVTGTGGIDDNTWYKNMLFNVGQPLTMDIYRVFMRHYWLSGFSFVIRRDVYEKSGGLDASLNSLDDLDLGFRVRKLGRIKICRDSMVIISGRRFKPHFVGGLLSYARPFFEVAVKRSGQVYMDDVR